MDSARDQSVIAILGGTGGIGSEVARLCAGRGHRVWLAARDRERLEETAGEVGARAESADATDPEAVDRLLARIREEEGRLDGVVNCVGSILIKPIHRTSPDEWRETIDKNLGSAFSVVRSAVRRLGPDGGSIVLVSSAAAAVGLANHEAIAAAKAGLEGLARSAAVTYAPSVRVNVVAAGLVETPLSRPLLGSDLARKASEAMHPLGRIGRPEDVAAAVRFLLSPEATWITGQTLGVDGGLATLRPRPTVAARPGNARSGGAR
jgi:NAD(P)-dependent dehydrogenase (short-subunit alcohol dehydrogenase family)